MVKSSLIIASVAAIAYTVSAQDQSLPTSIPSLSLSGVAIPAIPTEYASAVSSLMKNPSGLQSYISMASAKVSQLPSGVQGSVYSALSEASKTLDTVKPKNTGQSSTKSMGNTAQTPRYFAALAISIIVAVVV
ncbi:uncharacterized protein EV154DRAFT_504096, partial [Mucor mucedo]|uniref:uncharacterized protein n=1 Tax=Mucor mucedo TaxID=29922 RepID=UPI002220A63C